MLQTLPAYVQFNQGVAHFANNSALERMIYAAIERAIREIIHPVVERSVTIAAISTRELITKDFAMESDESKMRKAAHQMAQNLAGSLALVTCKEPLRISMVTHARTLFLQNGFTEQNVPEQAIMVIMQDNLDLACSVVERAAMQKSLQEVDDGLTNAYIARGEHRMRGRGFYWDANALAQSQYASTLPDLLKLKPDGLQAQQLRVYEEFGQMPRAVGDVADRASASPSMAHMQDTMLSYGGGVAVDSEARQRELLHQMHLAQQQSSQQQAQAIDSSAFPQDAALLSPQQSLERFTQCINNLEHVLQQSNERDSSNANDIRSLAQQIALLSLQSANRDETSLVFAQKVVQLLYKSESDLARDVYIHLLEQLCEISVKAAKEVTAWLLYAEDERKFNVAVTVGLIRAGLVNISEQDAQLSTFMQSREFKASIVDFSAKLAYACLKKPACATRQQLSGIIDTLVRAQQQGKATALADEFLHELQGGNLPVKTDVENSQPLREQLAFCFAEWIRLYQHSPNPDKSFIEFVTQLQGQGILKGEEISSMFFRVCAEVGVDSYIKHKAVGGNHITGIFQPIDAFSKLVVLLIKYHADPSGAKNEQAKVHYLTKILSIVVLVLAQSHEELGAHFQQKPFFRFFSSLLHDLHQAEASLQATYRQTLLAISNTLNTLQPSFFPGFTFSWMSLISHRLFMPKLLASTPANVEGNTDQDEGHVAFNRLFTSLLRFIAPIIRPYQLQDTSRVLYRGTMRIALVLLHDHPDFLATYADGLVGLVPPQCVQLRNLILSSYRREEFPSGLPDVMGINIAAPTSEILTAKEAVNYPDYDVALNAVGNGSLRSELDGFLRGSHSTESSATSILTKLCIDNKPASMALLSAVVLHVGVTSLAQTGNGNGWQENGVRILQIFLQQSDPERRYLLANSICDQLRYPNRRTAFYSSTLLRIYSEVKETREALLRVLLERTIVNRPHPWGLLATLFTLLSDDQRYPSPANTPEEIMKLLDHIRIGLGSGNTASTLKMNGNGSSSPGRFPYPQRHEIPT
jgi:CCR4-NOT transcription complex subunit 1